MTESMSKLPMNRATYSEVQSGTVARIAQARAPSLKIHISGSGVHLSSLLEKRASVNMLP